MLAARRSQHNNSQKLPLIYARQILGTTHFFNLADNGRTKEPARNFRRLTQTDTTSNAKTKI